MKAKATPQRLLKRLSRLRGRSGGYKLDQRSQVEEVLLRTILQSFTLQARYEQLRRTGDIQPIPFFGDSKPLTKGDLEALKKAAAVLREIGPARRSAP